MGGVPARNRPIPSTGSYSGPIANWSACENQPQIGERSSAWRPERT